MKTTINNNQELNQFISKIEPNDTYYAIRKKDRIEVYSSLKSFSLEASKFSTAPQGKITSTNFLLFRFI